MSGRLTYDDAKQLAGPPGKKGHHRCPICEKEASLSIDPGQDGTVLVNCWKTDCDRAEILRALREGATWLDGTTAPTKRPDRAEAKGQREDKDEWKQEEAQCICYRTKRNSTERATTYLQARGIDPSVVPRNAYLLPARTITQLPSGKPFHFRGKYPCVIFKVWRRNAVHVIALNAEANGKLATKKPVKRSYGSTKGGHVRLRRPDRDRPLIVAEGIETALSAAQLAGGLPAIATLGTSNMANLNIDELPACSEVIIARDRGSPGKNAAQTLGERLAREGYKVRVAVPPKERWSDWNDALQELRNAPKHVQRLRYKILDAPKVQPPADPLPWIEKYIPSPEQIAAIADQEMILPGLIARGQATVIPAPSGAGKTTLCMDYVAPQIAKQGYNVRYVNADIAAGDAKVAYNQAQSGGFRLLLPHFTDHEMEHIVKELENVASQGLDLSDEVWIFDNLKQMEDLMSKSKASLLYKLFRRLTAKGMTLIALAHTNKYPDDKGNPIFEGTGDLRNDFDNMIYLIDTPADETGWRTVSVKPDKWRAPLEQMTFEISPDRRVHWLDDYVDIGAKRQQEKQKERDEPTIELITQCLQEHGEQGAQQSAILTYVKESGTGIGRDTVQRVLRAYTDIWTCEQEPFNNARRYRLRSAGVGGKNPVNPRTAVNHRKPRKPRKPFGE